MPTPSLEELSFLPSCLCCLKNLFSPIFNFCVNDVDFEIGMLVMSRPRFGDRRDDSPNFSGSEVQHRNAYVLFRKRIRSQMYYGVTILFVIVVALSVSAIQGGFKFRKLTKSIRDRATEMPLAAQLSQKVSDLRVTFSRIHQPNDFKSYVDIRVQDSDYLAWEFSVNLGVVSSALADYAYQLEASNTSDALIADISLEQQAVEKLRNALILMERRTRGGNWVFDQALRLELEETLSQFQQDVSVLPQYLKQRMDSFAEKARTEYHTWITFSALMTIGATVLLILLTRRFHLRIFHPLQVLVNGSRRVASGDFDFRIRLKTNDEMSGLADAMNAMTSNFQEISTDLNSQVQQRSREVVRSEQMASVGFLAAGVAHEINNPLASIAWSAESLETRLHDILNPESVISQQERESEIQEMKKYLQRIQDEAFRCKGITSSLLDFSRLGDAQKTPTDMAELTEGVVDMLRPLSRYRDKNIAVNCQRSVMAMVNPQEIKQVVLNLVTNALDSVEFGGNVKIELTKTNVAQLTVTDNGCGMNPDVLQHIFEPFYTRRPDGQGTGLGLSISYRIIQEHHGAIHPFSEGNGKGSKFIVTLPLVKYDEEELKAA